MIHVRDTIQTKRLATREMLHQYSIVRPKWASRRWKGIHHGELVDIIDQGLQKRGVTVEEESWFLSGWKDSVLDGYMRLRIPTRQAPEGMGHCLGVSHSNNGDGSLKFAVGARVYICSNGMVVGEYVLRRWHTVGLSLISTIGDGLDMYLDRVQDVNATYERMQERELTQSQSDLMLMEAGRRGLMPWSRIGQVEQEFRKPSFPQFEHRNAWSLYNAFTYVAQKCPPHQQIPALNQFREIVLN